MIQLMQNFVQSPVGADLILAARNVKTFCFLVAVVALSVFMIGAKARCDPADGPWVLASKSSVRLIAGAPGRLPYGAGVEMRLDPGAITYWRTPGDAGAPPAFSFDGSENVANVTILFPAPKRIDEAGTEAFGYTGDVTFPLHIRPTDPALPVNLTMKMNFAVCERICLPNMVETKLTLLPEKAPSSLAGAGPASAIERAEEKVPVRLSETDRDKKVSIVRDPTASPPTWRLKLAEGANNVSGSQDGAADLFAEAPAGWYFETRKSGRPDEFLIVEAARPKTAAGTAAPVLLTLTQPRHSYEFAVELKPAAAIKP